MKRIDEKIMDLIRKREFVNVATCDHANRPNAAPKFVLKLDRNYIYLVDHTIGRTWRNLKINPRASLSFIDTNTLNGYQINGSVEIIEKGLEYKKIHDELLNKQISLTAKHIIEEVRGEGRHDNFEVALPERFVIFKVMLEEVVEIFSKGKVVRNKISKTR